MIAPPRFADLDDYAARGREVATWRDALTEVLDRHGLKTEAAPAAGIGSTYPVFVCGDVVVKFLGRLPGWRRALRCEMAAHALVATDPSILAPKIVAHGELADGAADRWAYLVLERIAGVGWGYAKPSRDEQLALADEVGRQIGRIHALPAPADQPAGTGFTPADIQKAAAQTVLPDHLVAEVARFMEAGEPDSSPEPAVFNHGDLGHRHAFVADGRLTGVIDWGDAGPADRHYELAKLHGNLFRWDPELLEVFLAAADWTPTPDFAMRGLRQSLLRQAVGLTEHLTFDNFYLARRVVPLDDIRTLEELADRLFGVG